LARTPITHEDVENFLSAVEHLVSGDRLSEADRSRRWKEVAYVLREANVARSERWMSGRRMEGL